MKKTRLFLLITFMILFLFSIALFQFNSLPQSEYSFNYLRKSANEIIINSPENKTYISSMSGYYPATYGFENDEIGTIPDEWQYRLTIPQADSYIQVISSLDGHNNVVDLNKGNTYGSHLHMWNNFSDQEYGVVEFWIRTSDISERSEFILRHQVDGSICAVGLGDGSTFFVYALGGWQSMPFSASENVWYHISIQFECGTGNHYSLNQYYFRIIINGVNSPDYRMAYDASVANQVTVLQNWLYENYHTYLDGIGYSWDPNYNIGDNLNDGLLLSFDVSVSYNWLGYSLDLNPNITILGDKAIPFPNNGVHKIQVYGRYPNGTYFSSEERHFTVDTPSINIISPLNTTYLESMSGYYPATYGFENDEIGTIPDEWQYRLTIPQADSYIQVISSLDGHNKVVDLNKGNTYGSHLHMWNNFSDQEYGLVEFWIRTSDISERSEFILRHQVDGSICAIGLGDGSTFFVYALGGWQSMPFSASENVWYHISIQFECGTGNHYSLNQYYFRIIINGVNSPDYRMAYDASVANQITVLQNWLYDNYHTYLDGIGYSWDPNYNIGDNLNEGLLLDYSIPVTLDWKAYSLDGGVNKTILGDTAIKMPSDGYHFIQFFANDSLGKTYKSEVRYFAVDLNSPELIIFSPEESHFYNTMPPNYSLSIIDAFLDSTWYSLDGGINTFNFSGTTGIINQTEWDKFGDGPVTITFYANDSFGRIESSEVHIHKDISSPVIVVMTPEVGDYYSSIAPDFNLTITEAYLNTTWYSLNGGSNFTFNGLTGSLNQLEWDSLPDGPVSIRFYCNDTIGHESNVDRLINKDSTNPSITINQPMDLTEFITHPVFNLTIVESNIESSWYTLSGSVETYDFTNPIGSIDPNAWDSLPDGPVTIRFYVRDLAGNQVFEEVTVIKQTPSSPIPEIPGYNFFVLLGLIGLGSLILIRKKLKS